MGDDSSEEVLRHLTPQVVGALVRRYGRFDAAEDAVQEALLVATRRRRDDGVPEQPYAWLLRVASRKLIDLLRAEQARRRREVTAAGRVPQGDRAGADDADDADDTLILLTLCCHPSLSPSSQIALTLRAVGGLTTAEIARVFLASEASTTRRITRALARGDVGPYQVQGAIAAIHDEAPTSEATDWRQIVALYRLLTRVSASPVVRLNHAVAMADGPAAGLALLDALDDPRLVRDRRLHAARAHLLERAGDLDAARAAYVRAARLATNIHHVLP